MQGELLRGTHGPFRKINNYNVATRDIGRAAALPPIVGHELTYGLMICPLDVHDRARLSLGVSLMLNPNTDVLSST